MPDGAGVEGPPTFAAGAVLGCDKSAMNHVSVRKRLCTHLADHAHDEAFLFNFVRFNGVGIRKHLAYMAMSMLQTLIAQAYLHVPE